MMEWIKQVISQKEMINFSWLLIYSALSIGLFCELHLSDSLSKVSVFSLRGISAIASYLTMIFAIGGVVVVLKLPEHSAFIALPMLMLYSFNHVLNGIVFWRDFKNKDAELKLKFTYNIIRFLGITVVILFVSQFELAIVVFKNKNLIQNLQTNRIEMSHLRKKQISMTTELVGVKKRVEILELNRRR